MRIKGSEEVSNFWVVGVNYKKTDASVRGQFAISDQQYDRLLSLAPKFKLNDLFILSTCNRTEVYGFSNDYKALSELLCVETKGDTSLFYEKAYIKQGEEAIQHLCNVSAGIDSQILGDYEILAQIKQAVKYSKKRGFISPFFERMLNMSLQASKSVKTNTILSNGTVSVAFAAIQYVKDNVDNYSNKRVLLLGTGKIGQNTCRNIVDYLDTRNVVLVNRTVTKAKKLAEELSLEYASIEDLEKQVREADIIFVATGANEPIIKKAHLLNAGEKIVLDLSIPYNVEPESNDLDNVSLINVDELSKISDETLQARKDEVPKANKIISEHIAEFLQWANARKNTSMLAKVKSILYDMSGMKCTHSNCPKTDQKVKKAIGNLAVKMKKESSHGCNCIETMNRFADEREVEHV